MNYEKLMGMYFGFYHTLRKKIIQRSARNGCKRRLSGKVKLTREQQNQIRKFYAPYGKVTTIFHQMYYEKTGKFSEKYLPLDIYTNIIDAYFNPREEAKVLDNKCYYRTIFSGLRQPENVVFRIGGFWYDGEMQLITIEKAKQIVAEEKELFLKVATESYGGKGVKCICRDDADYLDAFEAFVRETKGDLLAQRALKQHKDIAVINESSVNTIRMISLLTKDGPKIYSSIFRVGFKGKKVDNYTSGGLTIGIDEKGALRKYGFNIQGERFERHPSNDFVFEGYRLPGYEKAKAMVEKAHTMVPHFRLVSFDVAIDENGDPIFIEANLCKGSLEIHEFNNGPLFGDDTKKILDEVYGKI